MMRALPFRFRLTILYGSIFAGAAFLLCATALRMLQDSVKEIEYHELQERADDVRSVLLHAPTDASPDDLCRILDEQYRLKDDGKYLQVRDANGHWLFRSTRMLAENPPLPDPGLLSAAGTLASFHQGIHEVAALAYPITVRGVRYAVQTGVSRDKSTALLTAFRTNLLLLTPAVLFLAAIGGHWMSRTALRPVAELTAEAQRINDRNLDSRLPTSQAKDEISELALTLNAMLERIQRAFVSVRTFTGNASHELRTPVALLQTELEVALMRPRTPEEYRTILQQLHEVTVRMANLVESLLTLARADGGADTLMLAPIHLQSTFREIESIWRSPSERAAVHLVVDSVDGRVMVLGNQDGILRLLSILLENAIKFTPPGGIVHLGIGLQPEIAILSVEDTGCGIAKEHMPHIFERFYRVGPEREGLRYGSGLGLALAKWLTESHGTELHAESVPECGSRFSFSLACTKNMMESVPVLSDCTHTPSLDHRTEHSAAR
jgi:heavy metal sensor kinase